MASRGAMVPRRSPAAQAASAGHPAMRNVAFYRRTKPTMSLTAFMVSAAKLG
jgi:hypothetical protein